jgi:hypothetical protein
MARNRIIGQAHVDPRELLAHPLNHKVHTADQAKLLESILAQVGWVRHITVNKPTGRIVNGHLRVQQAIAAGADTVPVQYIDVTPDDEARIIALLDELAAMAVTDRDKLTALLKRVASDNGPLRAFFARIRAEMRSALPAEDDPDKDRAASEGVGYTILTVGDVRMPVTRTEYQAWRERMFERVGFDNGAIAEEMLSQLGFDHEAGTD